jgi:hypothetical protein
MFSVPTAELRLPSGIRERLKPAYEQFFANISGAMADAIFCPPGRSWLRAVRKLLVSPVPANQRRTVTGLLQPGLKKLIPSGGVCGRIFFAQSGCHVACFRINLPEDTVEKENGVFVETERANADRNGEQTDYSMSGESGQIGNGPRSGSTSAGPA